MRKRDHIRGCSSGTAGAATCEQRECVFEFLSVRLVVVAVCARVEFEGADGEEGFVGGVAVGVGVENGDELFELGWGWRDSEGSDIEDMSARVPSSLRRGRKKDVVHLHERRFKIVNGEHAVFLSVHRFREEAVRLFYLALFLRRDIVFLRELREAWLGCRCRGGRCSATWFAPGRLRFGARRHG